MSEESTTPDPVELAGRQLEAANRHDLDAFMGVFAPDAVYDASRDGLGVYEGAAAIRGLIGGWWDAFDDLRLTPEEVLDLGNGVLFAALRHDARPVGSTAQVDTHQAYVFVFAEGLVAQVTVYSDITEARSAAERLAEERGQAMSKENVEIVRSAFLAFADRGFDGLAEHLHPEINWRAMEGAPDDVGEMDGIEAARRYVQDWPDMFDDFTSEIEELCDIGGDQVVAVIHNTGRAKRSGVPTELHYAALYTIWDCKVVRIREYVTKTEALQAAGLSG